MIENRYQNVYRPISDEFEERKWDSAVEWVYLHIETRPPPLSLGMAVQIFPNLNYIYP